MSNARLRVLVFGGRFWKAANGAAAVTFALCMTLIIGMCGFVIDIGHVAYVQRELQASADAAALAGAHDINCCATSKALTTAATFSGLAGDDNQISGVTVSMVAGYPQLKCFASTGVSCSGVDNANGIVVKERADVPMWFAEIFGITSMPVTATSTAGLQGGPAKPLDIEIVLDTTHSMNDADASCSIAGASRLQCAEAGVATLLGDLSYSTDQVGLMVFPGPTPATVDDDYNCSGANPSITPYSSSTNYQVRGLGSDFKTASSGSSLNSSSGIVRATGGGGSGCPGMQAPGGEGTYYAGAISAAQNTLATSGRLGVQKVIILLSDGDANSQSGSQIDPSIASDQCQQAVAAAQNAANAGTWVYTVAYGSSTSSSGSCSTDLGKISACSTLQQMASSPKFFYSDTQNGASSCTSTNSTSDLVSAFSAIGASLGAPRLLPDNTT